MAKMKALEGVLSDTEVADKVIGEKPTPEKRMQVIEKVTEDLNKQLNTTNSIVRLGSKVGKPMPSIPTNLPTVDKKVIQCGGIPRGRIIEIFGPESSGKTTFCLHIIGQEQKTGELCAFVDSEHSLDATWANKLGVDVDNLLVSQPDSGEDSLETVDALIRSRAVSLIVVDSVAALVPQAELEGDYGNSNMGLQARLLSQAMRKQRGIIAQTGVTVIYTNQIREKIGVMFGSPETTTGGRALKFYASLRLDVRRIAAIKDGDEFIGHEMKIKAVKNKVGSPFKETVINLLYASGLDVFADWLEMGLQTGVAEKSGAWYSYGSDRIGQGATNACNTFKNNPEFFAKFQQEVLDKLKNP